MSTISMTTREWVREFDRGLAAMSPEQRMAEVDELLAYPGLPYLTRLIILDHFKGRDDACSIERRRTIAQLTAQKEAERLARAARTARDAERFARAIYKGTLGALVAHTHEHPRSCSPMLVFVCENIRQTINSGPFLLAYWRFVQAHLGRSPATGPANADAAVAAKYPLVLLQQHMLPHRPVVRLINCASDVSEAKQQKQ